MKKGIQSWKNCMRFVRYFFSIHGLVRTLFAPWHRDQLAKKPGVWGFFERLGFGLMSRIIGLFVRLLTIIIGIVVELLLYVAYPIFFFLPIVIHFEDLVLYGSIGRTWAYPRTFNLDKHARDMRSLPEYLVIDHDHAIAQVERTLSRKTQQNVLLVGNQGSGKTTRLSYLARRMYRDLSYPALNGKRLMELFPEEMTHGQIELCIKEAIRARNIILVIENIERFEILGIIEQYMDNNHFQMILTTDYGAYHARYKGHGNLNRVSEMVELLPPNDETTFLYLLDWCEKNNELHRFPDDVLLSIIDLSNKLILNTSQPEKSMDIAEELLNTPASTLRVSDVEELMSQKTGVPLGALQGEEKETLLHLEDVLNKHVIGQEPAIKGIVSSLKRSRAGVVDTKKPIGSFLFLGTTGVGKTHTAKMLAQHYFGGEGMMIRFDMSEFRELSSLGRFTERLADRIEDQPYALAFFDEIEKAHPDILNVFLQILDEGEFHTEGGRTISFRNTIIICTSNAGATYMMENDIASQDLLIDHIVMKGLLRPEFINRFDQTVLYQPLNRESIEVVARLILEDFNRYLLKKQKLQVAVTDALVKELAKRGHSRKFGLRPLHRVIQDEIETQVADHLLMGTIPESRIIDVTLSE